MQRRFADTLPENAVGGSLGGGGGGSELQGVAVSQITGDVYASADYRINEFSATGHFIRAFGLGVVSSGPDRATPQSAVQTLKLTATGGDYSLEFGGQKTAEIPVAAAPTEIQTELQALSSVGSENLSVTETAPRTYELTFTGALADNPEPTIATVSGTVEPLTGGTATVHTTETGATGFDVCESAHLDICGFGSQGASAGAIGEQVPSLAVAPPGAPNEGNLLIADANNHRVEEYTATGEPHPRLRY